MQDDIFDGLLIDSTKLNTLDYAKKRSPLAMYDLACSLYYGNWTQKDQSKALRLAEEILSFGAGVWPKDVYRNTLMLKGFILGGTGRNPEAAEIYLKILRMIAKLPPKDWNWYHITGCIEWLEACWADNPSLIKKLV